MPSFNFTFRLKILFGVMGTVIILLLVLLFAVRSETSRQIRWMTFQTQARADQAFAELERLYHQELLRFATRISLKNRVPAALQAAVEEEDNQVLIDAAVYELNLAQIPLAIFTDESGNPVITLVNGQVVDNIPIDMAELQVTQLLTSSSDSVSGYVMIRDHLYTIHGILLKLFGQPVGTMTIGFPVDNAFSDRMGKVIQGEIGFILSGQFLSATPLEKVPGLKQAMLNATDANEPVSVTLGDNLWVLIADPLQADSPKKGQRVLAVSLHEYLAPLYRIEDFFRLSGILALLLAIGLGISISRGLAAPVKRLVEVTQKVANGDYHARVEMKGKDELSRLADAFNQMTYGLELKEQYRGILDKVVSPEVAAEMVKGNITLGGENRVVTTLFADVRGFTSMTEGMEPQEVITMLNQYMEQATSAIDAEGGIVDKYVGDEIMAIFGAPVAYKDDPLRAVRAALKIKDNIRELNTRRQQQGEPGIKVGIGINTGIAVAGNMGSVNRLNYTVLGESVNIAARLCSQATPGDILISEFTQNKIVDHINTQERQAAPMKGISKPVKVFNVTGFKRKTSNPFNTLMMILLLLFSIIGGSEVLAAPRMVYVTSNGDFQVDISARLHLEGYLPQDMEPWLIRETDAFISGRFSLFTDIFWGERLYGLLELRIDRGEIPSNDDLTFRLQQGFLRYSFLASRNLYFQVGKFVSPFGQFSQRHDSAQDPFIRPPLLHEYRTMICPSIAPGNNDGFIRWKGVPDVFRPTGAPIIWDVPYQVGAMIFGTFGKIAFRAAAMNSAPSSEPVQWDLDLDQPWNYSLVGHLSWFVNPELTLGVSFNYGPYSLEELEYSLGYGYGLNINDYNQIMWGFNASYTRGRLIMNAELIIDTWQVPNVIKNPRDTSYYLEVMYKFIPGLYGAVRFNSIHFNKIPFTDGTLDQWDYNVQRVQMALGYRFSPSIEVRAEYMINHTSGPVEPKDNLLAIQWIWRL
jgi:adenylate cyclase